MRLLTASPRSACARCPSGEAPPFTRLLTASPDGGRLGRRDATRGIGFRVTRGGSAAIGGRAGLDALGPRPVARLQIGELSLVEHVAPAALAAVPDASASYDSGMRTTLTLDDDVAALLSRVQARRKEPLKTIVNQALREGLTRLTAPPRRGTYTTPSVSLGRCLVGNIDDVAGVLAVAEGEAAAPLRGPGVDAVP